jgi:hypothetical protein
MTGISRAGKGLKILLQEFIRKTRECLLVEWFRYENNIHT